MKITLADCPPELQEKLRADKEMFLGWQRDCELISLICFDSTPYIDKSRIMRCYEVIMMVGNTYFVYSQRIDGELFSNVVSTASLTIGTVRNILENSPDWAGLPKTSPFDEAI